MLKNDDFAFLEIHPKAKMKFFLFKKKKSLNFFVNDKKQTLNSSGNLSAVLFLNIEVGTENSLKLLIG